MNINTKSHLFLLISAILFGGNYVVGKELLGKPFGPEQIILSRMLGAAIIFGILARFNNDKQIERKDYIRLVLCGLFGVSLNQMLFFVGLQYTTPINASIIHTTSPILVLLFAFFILREKITLKKTAGIALGLSGAYLMVTQGKLSGLDSSLMQGNLIVFLNILAYSLYLVLAKPLFQKYNTYVVMKWIYSVGLIIAIPFTIESSQSFDWKSIDLRAGLLLGYLVVATSIVGYVLISKALKYVNASLVGFYIYLQPVFATLFAYAVGSGDLNPLKLFSMGLIFSGILLINEKKDLKPVPDRHQ